MTDGDWFEAVDATWPAAQFHHHDGWIIREGLGGGKRVSAASGSGDIELAERAQKSLGQDLLFMIRPQDGDLDAQLAARGYEIIDPVVILAKTLPSTGNSNSTTQGATQASVDIWEKGGIGPERRAVMDRAKGPKTIVQMTGGCAFVSCHKDVAMIHALEVDQDHRRKGIGRTLEQAASEWSPVPTIAALTVETNTASRGLFTAAGYKEVSKYHYRIKR